MDRKTEILDAIDQQVEYLLHTSVTPPADWLTGTVRLDTLVDAKDPSTVSMATVTFEPGARTNWHMQRWASTPA